MIVRSPGQVVELTLPSEEMLPLEERSVFGIRVLSYDQWTHWLRLLKGVRTEEQAMLTARDLLGMSLASVRNFWIEEPGGERRELQLEIVKERLSLQCMDSLHACVRELLELTEKAQTLNLERLKN